MIPTKASDLQTATTIEHPRPAIVAGSRPRPIVPTDMDQVWRFSQMVAKSGLAPKDMQKPETIMVAIMHGLEVGLTPLMALQRIAVINGRPAIWGDAAIGLVRASGLCEFVDETIVGNGDNMIASCRVKRKGEKETVDRTFSVADAKKAGLWDKTGPWKQYPKRMLQMRARAFALRDGFADVLGGLYIAEELDEEAPKPMKDVSRSATRPQPQGAPLPPTVPVQEAVTEVIDADGVVTDAEPAKGTRPLPPLARTKAAPQATEVIDEDALVAEIGQLLTMRDCTNFALRVSAMEDRLSAEGMNRLNSALLDRQTEISDSGG